MKAAQFLSILLAPLVCLAQTPPTGSYLIGAQSVPNSPSTAQFFWDVSGGLAAAPTPGVTPIKGRLLNRLPPSTLNQQWTANLLGSVGTSGLYSFSSKVAGPKVFFGIDVSGKAVTTSQETVFNVTVSLKFSNLYTIQPVGTSAPNMALTSNQVGAQQITSQPLVQGNALQLWALVAI